MQPRLAAAPALGPGRHRAGAARSRALDPGAPAARARARRRAPRPRPLRCRAAPRLPTQEAGWPVCPSGRPRGPPRAAAAGPRAQAELKL